MNVRLTLSLAALGAVLAACAHAPKVAVAPVEPEVVVASDSPIGHRLDEIVSINGPPSDQRDLPDGSRLYVWQSSSISATVGPARKGEIHTAGVSQQFCYYRLYAKPDAKGVIKVVAADEPTAGCMKLAMIGQAK